MHHSVNEPDNATRAQCEPRGAALADETAIPSDYARSAFGGSATLNSGDDIEDGISPHAPTPLCDSIVVVALCVLFIVALLKCQWLAAPSPNLDTPLRDAAGAGELPATGH